VAATFTASAAFSCRARIGHVYAALQVRSGGIDHRRFQAARVLFKLEFVAAPWPPRRGKGYGVTGAFTVAYPVAL